MTEPLPLLTSWVEVDAVCAHHPPPDIIAAFAIDSPQEGTRSIGQGLEINGWVIGYGVAVHGVRTLIDCREGRLNLLDVRRPDVAAGYPGIAHAGTSGFSIWAPIDPTRGEWHIVVEAVTASGIAIPLAGIRGQAGVEERIPPPDTRLLTAPDFVIVGTQRGGTTSLHAYLSEHPRIHPASTKELHYLTDRYDRGRDWYLGQFPEALPPGTLTGEATPYALFHPLAPGRLRTIAPDAKLIALLRNPVDRAYSHYLMERFRGDEPLDFAAALDAERERLIGEEERIMRDPTAISESHKHFSYVARGDYATQLARWFARFPRRQMLVLRSEDLYENPAEIFAQVTAFLNIARNVEVRFDAHNRLAGPPMDPAIRDRLTRHFAPLNARLADLLGWDPSWT